MGSASQQDSLDLLVTRQGEVRDALSGLPIEPDGSDPLLTLIDHMARGIRVEGERDVRFTWAAGHQGPLWSVYLQRIEFELRDVVHVRASRSPEAAFGLTRRELDVLGLLAAGWSNGVIAEALRLSPRTVTTHVDRVLRKTASDNRAAAAVLANDQGLVLLPLPVPPEDLQVLRPARVHRAGVIAASQPGPRGVPRRRSGGRASEPIVVGTVVPRNAWARCDGEEMVAGAQLAIEEINSRSGLSGRRLELRVHGVDLDSPTDPQNAVSFLLAENAHAIAAGYAAHQLRAVEISAGAGVPFLHASASAAVDDLVAQDKVRYRSVFQVCPPDRDYAVKFVEFMTHLRSSGRWSPHSPDLVVAAQSNWDVVDYGLERAARLAVSLGWNLIPLEVPDRVRAEAPAAWADIAGEVGPAAAVMVGSYTIDDHVAFLSTFLRRPSNTLVHSIYAPSVPRFRELMGGGADGVLWSTTTGTYSDHVARRFVEKFMHRFRRPPGRSMAGISYDRVHILANAWAQASPEDFDAVAERLGDTRHRGVNGSYVFEGAGQGTLTLGEQTADPSLGQAHTVFQIQEERNQLIWPDLYATASFRLPPWFGP